MVKEARRARRKAKKEERDRIKNFDPMTPPPAADTFPPYQKTDFFRFELIHQSKKSGARVGRIHTPHGTIDTPGYVAVGTNGALKCATLEQADALGMQLMFCNTYHLLIHPGPKLIKAAGGLHKFIHRDKPLITDSGGFQVFSLSHGSVHDEINMKSRGSKYKSGQRGQGVTVTEEGAIFQSYRDGSALKLTPESSVQAQKDYGADIIIPLDELPPYHINRERLEHSVQLSHRWMARSLRTHLADVKQQAMYAVIHGGIDEELRQRSIDYLTSLPFDGFAVGGSLGKDRDELIKLLEFVMPRLPKHKPNHLLGIADTGSIEQAVTLGVDTFDSCFPTRLGRHGTMLIPGGRININNAKFAEAFDTYFCLKDAGGASQYSAAYLRHLHRQHEPIAGTLMTLHNLKFMYTKMADIRQQILNDEI